MVLRLNDAMQIDAKRLSDDAVSLFIEEFKPYVNNIVDAMKKELVGSEFPDDWYSDVAANLDNSFKHGSKEIIIKAGLMPPYSKDVLWKALIINYGSGQFMDRVKNKYVGSYIGGSDFNTNRQPPYTIFTRPDQYYDPDKNAMVQGSASYDEYGNLVSKPLPSLAHPGSHWFENALTLMANNTVLSDAIEHASANVFLRLRLSQYIKFPDFNFTLKL